MYYYSAFGSVEVPKYNVEQTHIVVASDLAQTTINGGFTPTYSHFPPYQINLSGAMILASDYKKLRGAAGIVRPLYRKNETLQSSWIYATLLSVSNRRDTEQAEWVRVDMTFSATEHKWRGTAWGDPLALQDGNAIRWGSGAKWGSGIQWGSNSAGSAANGFQLTIPARSPIDVVFPNGDAPVTNVKLSFSFAGATAVQGDLAIVQADGVEARWIPDDYLAQGPHSYTWDCGRRRFQIDGATQSPQAITSLTRLHWVEIPAVYEGETPTPLTLYWAGDTDMSMTAEYYELWA